VILEYKVDKNTIEPKIPTSNILKSLLFIESPLKISILKHDIMIAIN
tara:strand:- start:7148 stop:7288 length:141 start_codon:yes stop_codon:yes gene_type:complete